MAPAEQNYVDHKKDMFALIRSFGQWCAELISSYRIYVITDYKALEYSTTIKPSNSHHPRWAELQAEYNFLIICRPGSQNSLGDALTRHTNEVDG